MIFFLNIIYQDINRSCYSTDGKKLNRVTDQYSYLRISAACEIIKGHFQDSLISFTFEDNPQLTTIGTSCFAYCKNHTTINLSTCSKLKIIGETAFEFCEAVTEVILPEGLLEIQFQAFLGVSKLVSITIPVSVEKIYKNAFYQISSLRNVQFKEGSKLTSLEEGVFSLLNRISTFQIPENVAFIHGYALDYPYLDYLTIHPKNKYLILGPANSVLSANRSILYFVGKKYLSSFEVPEQVTTIKTFCFFRAYFRTIKC
ncbi:surface antigen BspA-like [Trichomonas vaginalis G3]|uniref:Surface antigen BspA-like n=1 Tax=Trichomonas vaginalis (strain ATCC PRA-98 / G3) TaxID=412133 RepID=A2GL22_TRIV3|nr:regulation of response to stimulus [Trichomonas vaginalis G3]EAX82143.1 surface antigen BspA-like [Trichomonas vaginalis G3]KAI5506215.1 regulation of response to stimulus [Trichomonas vaginalis G3]|eukprot:XP_001295073.1 surface antigen BspA-like [Trichomonas vaginalis G3]